MPPRWRLFWTLFFVQVTSYALYCINFRAVAQGGYGVTAVSDVGLASLNFFVIRRVAHAPDSTFGWLGYTCGSVAGSVVGIWVSKAFL